MPGPVEAFLATGQLAGDLADALKAAPDLKHSPELALNVAKYGGNVSENAQAVAGVARARALTVATQRGGLSVDPNAMGYQGAVSTSGRGLRDPGTPGAPGLLADIGGAISGAAQTVGQSAEAFGKQIAGAAEGVPSTLAAGYNALGHAAMPSPATQAGIQSGNPTEVAAGGVSNLGGQLSAIANEPGHIMRYSEDAYARHGPMGLIKSLAPMVLTGAAVAALTHDPQAVDAAVADVSGEGATDEAATLTRAQERGQTARSVTKAVLKPGVAAVKAPVKAVSFLSTSPAALSGEVAGNLSSKIIYPDSWKRTADASSWVTPGIGTTFDKGHASAGQRLAELVGLQPGSTAFNALSSATDFLNFAVVPDPMAAAGRTYALAQKGELRVAGKLITSGASAPSAQAVENAAKQWIGVHNLFNHLVPMNSAGDIALTFPKLAGIAPDLARASTYDAVKQVVKDAAQTQEILTTSSIPELGPYTALKSALRNSVNPLSKTGKPIPFTRLGTPEPFALDPELAKFVGRRLPIGTPDGIRAVGQFMLGARMPRRVVNNTLDILYANAEPAIQIAAVKNSMKAFIGTEMKRVIGRSAPQDFTDAVLKAMNDGIDKNFGGQLAGRTGQFGRDTRGADLSRVVTNLDDPEEKTLAAAIDGNDASAFTVPSLRTLRRDIYNLANMEHWTAKNATLSGGLAFAQFLDTYINEKFFQRLALMTGTFAGHVIASEDLLNANRLGPLNFVASKLALSAQKQGLKLDDADIGTVSALLHGVMAGGYESAVKALGKERILDGAVAYVKMHGGATVDPALDMTHTSFARGTDMPSQYEADVEATIRRNGLLPKLFGGSEPGVKIKTVPLTDSYGILAPRTTGYFRAWSQRAARKSADPLVARPAIEAYKEAIDAGYNETAATQRAIAAVKAHLDAQAPGSLVHYARHHALSDDTTIARSTDPHENWAEIAVASLKGILYGRDGTFHRDLLDEMASGKTPDTQTMISRYSHLDAPSLPQAVPGQELNLKVHDPLGTLSNWGHAKVLGPIVNSLSREPTGLLDFVNERKMMEGHVKQGLLSQDQADVKANVRAINKSIRFVHNPLDRTKFENMVHLVAPFYFAQNQAIRRTFRLFGENPGAFEQQMKLMVGMNNIAHVVTIKNGTPVVTFPGSAIFGQGVASAMNAIGLLPTASVPLYLRGGADVSTTINPFSSGSETGTGALSLRTALQPSMGPVAGFPLKALQTFFSARAPKVSEAAAQVLGPIASSTSFWMQGMPNAIIQHTLEGIANYGIIEATDGQGSLAGAYTTATLSVMASMAAAGQLPSADELQGDISVGGDPRALAAFIKRANNTVMVNWAARTLAGALLPVSVSLQKAGLQYSSEVQSYINRAHGNVSQGLDKFSTDHPDLIPYEVFESTDPNGFSYPEVQKTAQWITANTHAVSTYPDVAGFLMPNTDTQGRFDYSALQMERALGLRKQDTPVEFADNIYITSGNAQYFDYFKPYADAAIAKRPNDKSYAYQVYQAMDQAVADYGTHVNPIWYSYWSGNQGLQKREQQVGRLEKMLNDPRVPKTELGAHLAQFVATYKEFKAAVLDASPSSQYYNLSATKQKAIWTEVVAEVTRKYPDMKPAAQSLFAGLG